MHPVFASAGKTQAIPIWFVHAGNFDSVRNEIGEHERIFIAAAGFEPKAGRLLLLPAADGKLAGVLFGIEGSERTGSRSVPARTIGRPVAARHLSFRQCAA